jgi:hypothetical protein
VDSRPPAPRQRPTQLFAEGKQWHGMRRFRMRGLWRVNTEALLTATGQNLKRLLQQRGWGRRPVPDGAPGAVAGWSVLNRLLVAVTVSGVALHSRNHQGFATNPTRCPSPFGLSSVLECRLRRPSQLNVPVSDGCRSVLWKRSCPRPRVRRVSSGVALCCRCWGHNWGRISARNCLTATGRHRGRQVNTNGVTGARCATN